MIESNRYSDVWQQAGIEAYLPVIAIISVRLTTGEDDASSELVVDGEEVCG